MGAPPGAAGRGARIIRATDDFEVLWQHTEDAERSWIWDEMHCPRPVAPMALSILEHFAPPGVPMRRIAINGYQYMSVGDTPRPPMWSPPGGDAVSAMELWEQTNLPQARVLVDGIRGREYSSMSIETLLDELPGLFDDSGRAFMRTMLVMGPMAMQMQALFDFCTEHLGEDGESVAATVLQGRENETSAAGAGLSQLADMASESQELSAAIINGEFDDLASRPGGERFVERFGSFLDEYGWRAESWWEVHVPTWAEDPSVPLRLIGRYIEDPDRSPRAAHQRSVAQRERAVEKATGRLADSDLRARFHELLAQAEDSVALREGRALWQLMAMGVLRIPLLEIGRRLVQADAIKQPDDVFFLYKGEPERLLAGDIDDAGTLVARRRADHGHWSGLRPPRFLGAEPLEMPAMPVMAGMMGLVRGGTLTASADGSVLNGAGASGGSARGPARVIASLEEAGRVQAGDVLVCRSTAPPWTVLFSIVSAVVTDSGGVLSHSAIVAREYGIPCVVGTGDATKRIPDGALVTVDGDSGTVAIDTQ